MRQAIQTQDAPQAIGPYSQAVKAGDLLFVSGQIPLDPSTGEMVKGDIKAQTEQVMKNIASILAAANVSFDHVVRTTIFLADLNDFAVVNKIYGNYFETPEPARAAFQVARLPKDARIEIDAIALL
ncbi:MAG: RidA family protein [Acidobacteriota bacterium]|nr:hypothetical protein [Acidobacteriota bacterium]MCS5670968.1 RidA family protein [Vicinamibacterales bacterium]MEE2609136.1 RidA family protein [Acidobacteriota bacterium]MEE3138507.1 RidA family protein [Acidobacteriota bacterium]HCH37908.1 hypothetical protein [Acidobacteriota bacterium]|tara:strand:+ start:1796 stop:2173 length:378 start_codon:yes stop_codon:yes gene_type:complete